MSEPIIEQIAQWLAAAVAEVTVANGYQQTLSVKRPEDLFIDGESIKDVKDDEGNHTLTTIIAQSECTADADPSMEEYFWRQNFDINVHFIAQPGDSVSLDTRINRCCADIQKRIGAEVAAIENGRLCGGLAYRIDLIAPEIEPVEEINATVLIVPVAICYEVNKNNPYEQV